ncbi:MAG: PspC domain-containing protein [Solirubrobacterales bacterium]|nr:PspC domain-containing protein [Solirubrobacterales bacterium]OJU94792.1 MAG: hypothetical protein BGO23_08030 [Solirubrobacterales bacterium 67-14]
MNEQSPPKKLSRSRNDRYIGGVAAGIAEHFNFDPIFARLAFVASLALGGLGLLAYVVLLVVMPVEGDPAEPLPPVDPKRRNLMIGLAVVVGIVGLSTADSGNFAGWLFGFWPGTVFGVLFWVAAGAGLAWLYFNGNFKFSGSTDGPVSESAPASAAPPPEPEPEPDEPSTEVVTFAASPTQLTPTEVMETRQMAAEETPTEPDTPVEDNLVRENRSSMVGKVMLWFAIGLTALIVFCLLFVFSAGITALFGGVPMAALVIVLGGGMIFAGVRGRRQLSLWLLTAAVAVTLPMAAVSIADLRVEGSYGDINETPLTVADIPGDGYKMAAGDTTIDLRKLDFGRHREIQLPVKSGMGLTSIVVPDDVCVTGDVQGKAGVISFRGKESNGIDVSQASALRVPRNGPVRLARREVRLDGEFKLGAFEVVDNTQWERFGSGGSFDRHDHGAGDASQSLARERATAACSEVYTPGGGREKS